MNKTLVTVGTVSLALGLALGTTAQAATPKAKPTIAASKKPTVAKGKEGTATHEMSEATSGTGEEGTKKVAKATKSVIVKKPTAKPSAKPTK